MNKKAVIYARYSSAGQTEQSIEGQLRVNKEFAERTGYVVLGEYIDRAITGTNDNRPEFQKMLEDAKKGEFQFIIVYKLDRFSRNKYDSVFHKHQLAKLGVRVVSATEAISDTMEGQLVETILEYMAEMYSKDLSQKVKRGNRESVIKGTTLGSCPPLGYKVVDKRLVIDEDTAPIMRFIFEEYAKGTPKKDIMNSLNAKGYKTTRGKQFSMTSMQTNLKNTKYIGVYSACGVVNENYCQPLIDKDIFFEVQKKLAEKSHAPASHRRAKYLLTGKCFCGHCGETMCGISAVGHTGCLRRYYACIGQYRKKKCSKKYSGKEELEDKIYEQTLKQLLDTKSANEIADKMVAFFDSDINATTVREYERKIESVENEIEKCFKLMLNCVDNETMLAKAKVQAKDLELRKNDLQDELSKLHIATGIKHTKQDILAMLDLMAKTASKEFIIDKFVSGVFVWDDKVFVTYNMFDNETPTQQDVVDILENNGVILSNDLAEREGFEPPVVLPIVSFQD